MTNQDLETYDDVVGARKKKTWGGARPGSGRKPVLDDPVTFASELERAEVDALKAIAEERGVSVASLVRAAVTAYVKRHRRS